MTLQRNNSYLIEANFDPKLQSFTGQMEVSFIRVGARYWLCGGWRVTGGNLVVEVEVVEVVVWCPPYCRDI